VTSNQQVLKTPHKPAPMKNMPADSTNLKNFFQNLLSKNAPSGTNAASGQSQPSDQQQNQSGILIEKFSTLILLFVKATV
jgi:hypothetical protein